MHCPRNTGRFCWAKHLWNVHSTLFLFTVVLNVVKICWKVEFKRNCPWAFLLCSVMSTIFSWCCGEILILKDLKLDSQAGLQQRHILCEYSAEGSFEEVWLQTAVLGWFENSRSVFWKTPEQCVMYLLHLLTKKFLGFRLSCPAGTGSFAVEKMSTLLTTVQLHVLNPELKGTFNMLEFCAHILMHASNSVREREREMQQRQKKISTNGLVRCDCNHQTFLQIGVKLPVLE